MVEGWYMARGDRGDDFQAYLFLGGRGAEREVQL